MSIKVLTQRDYSKGLVVVTQTFGSPPGSVIQISNMTYARRGGLATIGGTRNLTIPASSFRASAGAVLDTFFFNPPGVTGYNVFLMEELTGGLENTDLMKAVPNYTIAARLATFPQSNLNAATSIGNGALLTPSGGVLNQVSAGAKMLQFNGNIIILLGNGLAPNAYPNGGPAAPLPNNFVSSFPIWQAATNYQLGTFVIKNPSNGHLYRCVQAGLSGGVQPVFPTTAETIISDGSVIWQEAGSNAVQPPQGAAHGVVHSGFLWLYNTAPTTAANFLSGPSCLQMSDLNTFSSWNPLNLAHLDRDDGTEGTGLASFAVSEVGIAPTLALAAFKTYKTFLINSVFGSPNFYITRIRTDMGCIAPKSIQVVEGLGIIRLTHRGFALFDGVQDTLLSEAIRPYIFQEQLAISGVEPGLVGWATAGQTTNPPVYYCAVPLIGSNGPFTRLFSWDVTTQAWSIVDLPFSVLGMNQLLQSPFIGTQPMVMGGFAPPYNGNVIQWEPQQQGASTWATATNTGTPATVAWSFTTPETFAKAPSNRTYFRRLLIRGSYYGAQPLQMTCVVTVNGAAQPQVTAKRFNFTTGAQFECEVPIGLTGLSANAQISGLDSVEIGSVEWHLVPKPEGPPASFMQ